MFERTDGSCQGPANAFVRLADAAAGACRARCLEQAVYGAEPCVAYATSTSPWEADYCSLWDPDGFQGPGGDGHGSGRECYAMRLTRVRGQECDGQPDDQWACASVL